MTECYELSISPDYVKDWGYLDAIRELIQNGTDQEILNEKNKFELIYDFDNKILMFKNQCSKLKVETLLLGCSTKSKNEDTVGQFGEGYKIAALVLTRLNKKFTIFNNEKNERWICKFKNSEKWHNKILAFYIEKYITEEKGLTIAIENISPEEFWEINTIWINNKDNSWERIETSYGEILMDKELSQKIFVNGLYVYTDKSMRYGFNFKSKYIKLERDRKTCSSWDIGDFSSRMIIEAAMMGKFSVGELIKLLEEDSGEIYHFRFNKYSLNAKDLKLKIMEVFNNKYPDFSVPAYTQTQINRIKALGGNPIAVSSGFAEFLFDEIEEKIIKLSKTIPADILTPKKKLEVWLLTYGERLSEKAISDFNEIINDI